MCGIAGSIHFPLNIPRLTKDLWHRGPDAQATFSEGNLQLHHHRLAILDIASGGQPMHYEHLTIIFNGEIYNHQEVRKKYGFLCSTQSDTETILHAYGKLGAACLQEFDGMFAFVIYDRKENRLFAARDRAGKKPFYYYHYGNRFVFASELNALKNQVEPAINEQHISQYLYYGAFHRTSTPYINIFELPPASYACISLHDTSLSVHQWWSITPFYEKPLQIQEAEASERVNSLLHTAIKRRLESSDLEVGSFLSGGIDSGLVTAIAAQYKPSLKTFTVSFTGSYDEAPLARLVAEKYKTHHTEIKISFDELGQDIENILANYGEPFYDDSAIPSYYVSKEARKYLTVILNGDGSDELFGGYRRYVPFSKYDFFSKPGIVTGTASLVRKMMPVVHEKQSKLNYLYRLADLASKKGADVYYSSTTDIFTGFYEHFVQPGEMISGGLPSLLSAVNGLSISGLQKMMLMDFNAILPDILLVKMDIATMASSLEGRSPFLAKEILEYAPALQDKLKIRGATTKYLLRRLAARYLPEELINQPKRGFEVPLKQWVDTELKDIIFSYLQSEDSYASHYIEKTFIRQLLDRKVKVSDEKRAKMLYTLFTLDVWYKKCYLNNSQH